MSIASDRPDVSFERDVVWSLRERDHAVGGYKLIRIKVCDFSFDFLFEQKLGVADTVSHFGEIAECQFSDGIGIHFSAVLIQ